MEIFLISLRNFPEHKKNSILARLPSEAPQNAIRSN
jgi:hypothetical protein